MIEPSRPLPNPFDTSFNKPNSKFPEILAANEFLISDSTEFEVSYSHIKSQTPNFPLFFPIVYHSIGIEIPQKYSFITRMCYCVALSFSYVLLFSFFMQMFSKNIESYLIIPWRELILSSFILMVCPAALFYSQYFPLYYSIRDQKPNPSLIPFQFCIIFFMIFFAAGIPGSGVIGLGYAIICYNQSNIIQQVISLIITGWHFLNLIFEIIIFFLIIPINSDLSSH